MRAHNLPTGIAFSSVSSECRKCGVETRAGSVNERGREWKSMSPFPYTCSVLPKLVCARQMVEPANPLLLIPQTWFIMSRLRPHGDDKHGATHARCSQCR